MKKFLAITILLVLAKLAFAVPPCPEKKNGIINTKEMPSDVFSKYKNEKNSNVPDSILVLLTDFSDVKFKTADESFENVDHNYDYFKKYMEHLSEYYHDASHGKYILQPSFYTFYPQIVTLPKSMSYYGNDEEWSARVAEFTQSVIQAVDADIDFNNFDSIIIFHAGAGQETDVTGNNSDDLWTTFMTRKSLQSGLDPDNDDFMGILTNDNKYVKEAIIMPESQQQPDYDPASSVKYGLLGVLAHEFGHLLGLPTLFDNYSGNGRSAGIGNFGLMGTGVWNANGFVPPLPCAWSRYYLGWENDNIVEVNYDMDNCEIAYPMMETPLTPKLYKVGISDKEYFLVENRQENPDNSTIHGFPNFTFTLLPDTLQDYYPAPNNDVPVFNFMENSYLGSEWDFFLPGPGYGEPPDSTTVNGSGLFIWHIDEYMIDMLFTPDFEYNSVNYDASHKGVDLEEASGYQYLDAIKTMDSFGTPYASYREGNNTYFGFEINPETDLYSLPTSESYYGGTNIEIKNISASSNIMSFSVSYKDKSAFNPFDIYPNYNGISTYPPTIGNLDSTYPETEICYIMPDGYVFYWNVDGSLNSSLSMQLTPITELYAFDDINKRFVLPTMIDSSAAYYRYSYNINDFDLINLDSGYNWASHPVVNRTLDSEVRAVLPLNSENDAEIVFLDNDFSEYYKTTLDSTAIISNIMLKNNVAELFVKKDDNVQLMKVDFEALSNDLNTVNVPELNDKNINSALLADIDSDGNDDYVVTANDTLLYIFDENGQAFDNFPVTITLHKSSVPSIADIDNNGDLDILIGGENRFVSVDKKGNITKPYHETSFPDSLNRTSGVVAYDIDGDGRKEVAGNFSKNRLAIWESDNGNDFTLKETPVSYRKFSRFAPIITNYCSSSASSKAYRKPRIFVATDNGMIFSKELTGIEEVDHEFWFTEYANYARTASYEGETPENTYSKSNIFVDGENYIYPNPLTKINSGSIFRGNRRENTISVRFMTSDNLKVELNIYTIAGDLIKKDVKNATKFIADTFDVNAQDLSSGVYICILKAGDETKKMKFAVEK